MTCQVENGKKLDPNKKIISNHEGIKAGWQYIPLISHVFGPYCKLRTTFFFHAWAINRWKKRGSVIYSTDRKNKADKMFIIWLLPFLGKGNKCRTHDLTGVKKESFYWGMKTIAHKGLRESKNKLAMLKRFIWSKLRAL